MALEFEEEWPGGRAEVRFSIRCKHHILEHTGVEQSGVDLPGFHAIPRVTRKGRDGEFFPDLEAHFEALWDLIEIVTELIGRWWPVEARIVADGTKERLSVIEILAVFA